MGHDGPYKKDGLKYLLKIHKLVKTYFQTHTVVATPAATRPCYVAKVPTLDGHTTI